MAGDGFQPHVANFHGISLSIVLDLPLHVPVCLPDLFLSWQHQQWQLNEGYP